jgi:hypothetical protein
LGRKEHKHEQEEQEEEQEEELEEELEEEAEELEAVVRFKHHKLLEDDFANFSSEDESAEVRGIAESSKVKKGKQAIKASSLPSIPSFTPLTHSQPPHEKSTESLPTLPDSKPSILGVFREFFPNNILKTIVINTNYYAAVKDAGESGREWTALTIPELLTWLAICIYCGLFKAGGSLEWLWDKDPHKPTHHITQYMSLFRFQQIKRFLHISLHGQNIGDYYSKVEPLLSHVRNISKLLYIPSSFLSIDEMIVRFTGRSPHTFRLKGKPTPEGFKILALCDYGYTWTFLPTSRINTNKEVKKIDQINGTGCLVLHLVEQLPFKLKAFNIFMDNYFSSIPLFQHLRLMRIGACGTCQTNSAKFPKVLKVGKETKLDWDTRSGVVVDDVLATLWIDNGAVTMLSTIHELIGDDWEVKRN